MTPSPGASPVLEEKLRRRLSAVFAVLVAIALGAIGALQLGKDGAFWLDEAAVAVSLMDYSALELFGRLEGGQSFPRFLLFAISGLTDLFGYSTLVARALPQMFFLLLCAAWMRLVYLRFRDEPGLVLAAGLLFAIPATPFVYAAMLKPYTFDAFLALVPFLLGDDFYARLLGRGDRLMRGVALTALGWLSYPFAMALLARLGGWWLARAVRGDPQVSLRGVATVACGIGVFGAGLWLTDIRHTAELAPALQNFWGHCVIGHASADTATALDRLTVGWWDGRTEFSRGGGLPEAAIALVRLAMAAGFIGVVWSLRRAPDSHWGSRSLGCAGLLAGLPLASWVVGYPVCAGRLTLFALLPLVILAGEGLAALASLVRRVPYGGWAAAGLGAALVLVLAPVSWRDARSLIEAPAPSDLRPLIARARKRPELPILSTACTRRLLDTLPEGLHAPVLYGVLGVYEVALSESREAWLLIVPAEYCAPGVREIRANAEIFEARHDKGADAHLFYVRLPDPRAH